MGPFNAFEVLDIDQYILFIKMWFKTDSWLYLVPFNLRKTGNSPTVLLTLQYFGPNTHSQEVPPVTEMFRKN